MFIKTTKRKKPNNKTYFCHYLTKSYRDPTTGRPKHKYIANLTHLPEKLILVLKAAIKGERSDIEKINLEELEVLCSKEYGSVKLFQKLFRENFGKYFTDSEYNLALEAIVINKIFDAKSKNSLNNWISKTDIGYSFPNKNHLYESLDYLEGLQSEIEKDLATKEKECSILLYDITS